MFEFVVKSLKITTINTPKATSNSFPHNPYAPHVEKHLASDAHSIKSDRKG